MFSIYILFFFYVKFLNYSLNLGILIKKISCNSLFYIFCFVYFYCVLWYLHIKYLLWKVFFYYFKCLLCKTKYNEIADQLHYEFNMHNKRQEKNSWLDNIFFPNCKKYEIPVTNQELRFMLILCEKQVIYLC